MEITNKNLLIIHIGGGFITCPLSTPRVLVLLDPAFGRSSEVASLANVISFYSSSVHFMILPPPSSPNYGLLTHHVDPLLTSSIQLHHAPQSVGNGT